MMPMSKNKYPKYLQKKGSGNRLYIPDFARMHLQDVDMPLYITEGEKKALKACQEGLCCIAIAGLWNWTNGEKQLIKDFDDILLKNREVFIVPDSDWLEPTMHGYLKNLKQAVSKLAFKLKERGAKVFIVSLPKKEEGK